MDKIHIFIAFCRHLQQKSVNLQRNFGEQSFSVLTLAKFSMLKLAIQKSGRLSEDSLNLLNKCGIRLHHNKTRLLCPAENFPIEILFLRDDDIPGYVEDGVADVGIVGENVWLEAGALPKPVERLGFGKCRLSIAIPRDYPYSTISDLEGKDIATSYPVILGNFLREKGINATLHEISGSVEIAPSIGLADAVCDLVSSGGTLLSNGLKEVETILKSEAVLIRRQELSAEKEHILSDLCFRIKAVLTANRYKYVLMNVPNDQIDAVAKILPGMKSPTVMPLAEEGWSSVHSVIPESDYWHIIDQLQACGAQGILVSPIHQMIL